MSLAWRAHKMALKLSPEPKTVRLIRNMRQLSVEAVATAAGMPVNIISEVEERKTEISRNQLISLAKTLAVPPQYLFFERLAMAPNLPDFRTIQNRPAVLTPAGLARVERARSIISYLDDDVFSKAIKSSLVGSIKIDEGVPVAANFVKKYYTSVEDGRGAVDPVITFRETRVSLEKAGVVVLCDKVSGDEFRGFCFSEKGKQPLILLNTAERRPATKLFTLMHEFVHVCLGMTGVSDPSFVENKVERFCNSVAASVMMPEKEFRTVFREVRSSEDARIITNKISRYFGVSKSAAALRVSDLGIDTGFYSRWVRSLPTRIPLIQEEDEAEASQSTGGGIGAQVARFGYLLPKVLGKAISDKAISRIDAYRLTHLKPETVGKLAVIGANKLGG